MSGIDEKFSEEENTLYLVCDGYPVHHNEIARLAASDLNIKLIMIPKGATDECQPLDRRIFGNLKNKAKSIHQKKAVRKVLESMISGMELELDKPDKPYACHVFSEVRKTLNPYRIENAWNLAIYGAEGGSQGV